MPDVLASRRGCLLIFRLRLGAAEITLMEQTSAYSVFPNDGVRVIPRYITRVTDYEGRVLEEDFPT